MSAHHPPPPTAEEADWIVLALLAIAASPVFLFAAMGAAFWTGFSPDGHTWTSRDYLVIFPSLFLRGVIHLGLKFWFLSIPWVICFSATIVRVYRSKRGPTRRQSQRRDLSRRVRSKELRDETTELES